MEVIDGNKTKCEKCDEVLKLENAVALEKRHNKHYLKILCSDCLNTVGVPQGYTIERDISYLKRE